MKKILSLFLSFVMFISISVPAISCYALNTSIKERNPYYTGDFIQRANRLGVSMLAENKPLASSRVKNGVKYYNECDELYKQVRDGMAKRKNNILVHFYSNSRMSVFDSRALMHSVFTNATEDRLSVSSVDGDYARWSINYMRLDLQGMTSTSNYYYYDIIFNYEYYTTNSQEAKASSKIDSIVKSVRKKNMSDYKTIKYVHDLICKTASYDYKALSQSGCDYAYSAYGILCEGKGVCQGYALAFYRICKELGYSVRFVSSDPNIGCHAWNLIKLDNKYYFVDATWDDLDDGYMYDYFLVDYDTLRKDDDGNYTHELESDRYDNNYYITNYGNKTSKTSFDYNSAKGFSTCSIELKKYDWVATGNEIKPSISIKDKNGNAISSSNYTVSYSKNVNSGVANATINGKNNFAGYSTKRTFAISPKKMTTVSTKSGSRTSSSFTLTWKVASDKVSGYQIQQYKNGDWKIIKTINDGNVSSCVINNLSPSTTYTFKIRSFKNYNNHTLYGEYSNRKRASTIPKSVSTPTLSTKSKAVTVKWKKVTCSGYEIQYSTNSSMKNAKKVFSSYSNSTKKISSLKKGRRYYVRVRAYKTHTTIEGKKYKYYTKWSSKKSIIVK